MSGSGGGHDRGDLGVGETLRNDDRDGRRHCTRGRAGTSRSVKLGNFNFENFSFFLGHLELYRLYIRYTSETVKRRKKREGEKVVAERRRKHSTRGASYESRES